MVSMAESRRAAAGIGSNQARPRSEITTRGAGCQVVPRTLRALGTQQSVMITPGMERGWRRVARKDDACVYPAASERYDITKVSRILGFWLKAHLACQSKPKIMD